MATNNSTNSTFSGGLSALGTVNINATTANAITIGNASAGAINLASGSASSFTLNNKTFTLAFGTGTFNLGTDATAKTINVGSSSLNAAFTCSTPNGSFTQQGITGGGGSGNFTIQNNGGDIVIDSNATGAITISASVGTGNHTFNIGTVAGSYPITLGNTSSTSSLTINGGSGGLNIGTGGSGCSINIGNTTGATSLTLSAANISYPFTNITGTTATLIPGTIHTINSGALLCTVTLPTTCPVGSIINLVGFASGLWLIAQNSGQNIVSTASSTSVGVLGTLAAVNRYSCVEIECIVADTTWVIKSFTGTLTFV